MNSPCSQIRLQHRTKSHTSTFYDLSQTGHMSYDYVSLREGEPDGIAVTQFNLRKIDQSLWKGADTCAGENRKPT